jgi:hypothetical protein
MATEVALLQGGPKHLMTIRVQTDHNEIVLDQGGKLPPVTYRRRAGADSPAGVPFDFVPPSQDATPVA